MVGLLSQQPAPAAQPGQPPAPDVPGTVPGAPFPVSQAGSDPQPNVSADEQAQYDEFVDNAFSAIFDDQSMPQILQSLEGGGKPIDGLAQTTVNVVTRVEDSAEQAGKEISEDVVFNAGIEILENLADLAEKAGIHEYTAEEIEGATFQAMDLYRQSRNIGIGEMDQRYASTFGEMQDLSESGGLEKQAPGITERFSGPGRR